MSLVAYGSSDDSDSEETSSSLTSGSKSAGLFALLPSPKKSISGPPNRDASTHYSAIRSTLSNDDAAENTPARSQTLKGGLLFDLTKPKKRTEPVKITIPQLNKDSDSDEDEPARKRVVPQGSGLSSLLPQPRNMTIKETGRSLVPHTLTKRPDPKASKPTKPSVTGLSSSSASPSAIKAAAKSAALQLARQMAADDQESDEELSPENYFSLGDSSLPLPAVDPSLDPEPGAPSALLPNPVAVETGSFQSDAPLEFGLGGEEASGSVWVGQQHAPLHPQYLEPSVEPAPETVPQGYYNEAYYQNPDPSLAEADEPGSSGLFDDEAFRRLQGKRNRGKEEVKFLEIKGDDQLSGNQQWMAKSITEEKQERKSFSKKKGDQPTGQQRRKHQITYLIHQAKERELELKNNWAENKLTRRQTQAKYGF
ncbi:proline-rich protein PRCC [Osmerus eperlanus]|uniref:proline-rich protein PRCC n=1 Tax=Osmerus eperlanus TaxID=29151 RepID=UPI002E156472